MEGNYELAFYWYGCENNKQQQQRQQQEQEQEQSIQRIQAMKKIKATSLNNNKQHMTSNDNISRNNNSLSVFPESSAWISSNKFQQQQSSSSFSYVWHDSKINPSNATLLKAMTMTTTMTTNFDKNNNNDNSDIVLSKDGVGNNFYGFKRLSNYELVCWVGTESARLLRERFLQIRPMIAGMQRPFKFYFYPVRYFDKPDREWELETKKRFRKCKHILVSLDEVRVDDNEQYRLLSQREYANKMTTFINQGRRRLLR